MSGVHPDVSAFTILEMLRQLGHDPALLEAALGSIYEQVRPLPEGGFDLRRDGQPYAWAQCAPGTCAFEYWDHAARVTAFAVQSSMWTEQNIGPLTGSWPIRSAGAGRQKIEITHTSGEIRIKMWTTLP